MERRVTMRTQTQGLAQIRVSPLVQDALRAKADAPRTVDWARFAVRPYNREMAPRQVVIAVVFGAIFAATFLVEDNGIEIWIVRIVVGGGGLWILGAGLIAGVQIAWHTSRGLHAVAEVTTCDRSPEKPLEVGGERVVRHPALGDYLDGYLFSAPWAPTLRPGDRLEVLVDPTRTRTWFTIALDGGEIT